MAQYLTVEVNRANQVKGMLTTYTHFGITVKQVAPIPSDLPVDNRDILPIAPYHAKILKRSRRLCQWTPGTVVDRRYSELTDLRSYLVMAYPMLVFPPLPAKTAIDNLNTTFASEVHLAEQRRSILSFLKSLLLMNDVVLYDHHVVNALQQEHTVYAADGLVAMRGDLASMVSAQAHIDDHKSLHQRPGAAPTAALVEGTSKALRGFFSYMSGAPVSSGPDLASIRKQLDSDVNYTKWIPILHYVRDMNISLTSSAERLHKLLIPLDEMNVATLNITGPVIEYGRVLETCGSFKPLSNDVAGFRQVFESIGNSHKKDVDLLRTRVVDQLRMEAAWMASAEAAIESILALFTHVGTVMADFYQCGTVEASNLKSFLEKCCATLSSEIGNATGAAHQRRMAHLLTKYVEIFNKSLAEEHASIVSTPYYERRLGETRQSEADDWAEQLQNLPWTR